MKEAKSTAELLRMWVNGETDAQRRSLFSAPREYQAIEGDDLVFGEGETRRVVGRRVGSVFYVDPKARTSSWVISNFPKSHREHRRVCKLPDPIEETVKFERNEELFADYDPIAGF